LDSEFSSVQLTYVSDLYQAAQAVPWVFITNHLTLTAQRDARQVNSSVKPYG
jgi:hypothetical protein